MRRLVLAALFALACASSTPAPLPEPVAQTSPRDRDIFVVFDVSKAGMDPWPDRDFPREPGTYLVHEVRAARLFVEKVDRDGAVLGFAAFAGDVPGRDEPRKPAWTVTPLTDDAFTIERGLTALEAREPAGNSHLAAGVDQGTIELAGLRGKQSSPRPGARPVMIVFNEGVPNLPYGPSATKENFTAVRRALSRADRAGIEVYLVAFGRDAGDLAELQEAVVATGGAYLRADTPEQLRDVMTQLAQRLSPAPAP
jgi:hypothetical protein